MAHINDTEAVQDERFWNYVRKTSQEVAHWPDWMKGGTQEGIREPSGKLHMRASTAKESSGSKER